MHFDSRQEISFSREPAQAQENHTCIGKKMASCTMQGFLSDFESEWQMLDSFSIKL